MYLPNLGPSGSPTCPLQWGAFLEPGPCTYPSNYTLVANVQDVVNNPSAVAGDGVTPTQPIFSYDFTDLNMPAQTQQSIALTATEVQNNQMTGLTAAAYGYPTDTQTLNSCAASSIQYPTVAIACPSDAIGSVGLDLMVAKPGTSAQGTVENSLVIYRYAASPGSSTAPYQYSETQG